MRYALCVFMAVILMGPLYSLELMPTLNWVNIMSNAIGRATFYFGYCNMKRQEALERGRQRAFDREMQEFRERQAIMRNFYLKNLLIAHCSVGYQSNGWNKTWNQEVKYLLRKFENEIRLNPTLTVEALRECLYRKADDQADDKVNFGERNGTTLYKNDYAYCVLIKKGNPPV